MKLSIGKPQIKGDKIIWIVYFGLSILSLIFVFSTMGKNIYRLDGDVSYMFFKQIGIICVGIFATYIAHRIKYDNYARVLKLLYAISVVGLFVTLGIGEMFGKAANRWIELPFIGQFQPSEIVKYVLILYVASELASLKDRIKETKEFVILMIKISVICGLIFPENFSTAALLFLACFLMVFVAGAKLKHLFMTIVVGVSLIAFVFLLSYFGIEIGRNITWLNRFVAHYNGDPNEYNQANSAIMAIATGGLSGLGIGNTVEGRFLSESHNDFIFAIILEEGGIFMCVLILLAYFALFYRCIAVSRNAKGLFGKYIVLGIAFVIIIQALINMTVATGIIPVTGQTLPFLSYGGTSFLFSSCALGVVLNVSAESQKKKQNTMVATNEEENQIEKENTNIEQL